jgi:hypothetical protein
MEDTRLTRPDLLRQKGHHKAKFAKNAGLPQRSNNLSNNVSAGTPKRVGPPKNFHQLSISERINARFFS